MALKWIEGFDWTCDRDDFNSRYDVFSAYAMKFSTSFVGRTGTGRHARCTTMDDAYVRKIVALTGDAITGFGYKLLSGDIERAYDILIFSDMNGVDHLSLGVTLGGAMLLQRGTTASSPVTLGTVMATIPRDTWMFIEMRANIHDTTGSVTVRIDDVDVLTLTGIDTNNGGLSSVGRVMLGHRASPLLSSSSAADCFDDWYIADTSDGAGFLGSGFQVKTLAVNGPGGLSEFTPVGAASNYLAVDDSFTSNLSVTEADYVTSNVPGKKDLYNIESLAGSPGSVMAVNVSTVARKEDVGPGLIRHLVMSGSTIGSGTLNHALTTGNSTKSTLFFTNPDTGNAWAPDDIGSLQVGMEVG